MESLKRHNEQLTEMMAEVEKVLLPHQQKRIGQINRQQRLKFQIPYYGHLGLPLFVADELELDAQQKAKLEAATKEADEKLREKLAELNEKAMKKVLDGLPKDKRDQFEKLTGVLVNRDELRKRKAFNQE